MIFGVTKDNSLEINQGWFNFRIRVLPAYKIISHPGFAQHPVVLTIPSMDLEIHHHGLRIWLTIRPQAMIASVQFGRKVLLRANVLKERRFPNQNPATYTTVRTVYGGSAATGRKMECLAVVTRTVPKMVAACDEQPEVFTRTWNFITSNTCQNALTDKFTFSFSLTRLKIIHEVC